MNERQQPFDEDARRRRLDALFADEPFLSPTMKARRLNQNAVELPPAFDMPKPQAAAPSPTPAREVAPAETPSVPSRPKAIRQRKGMSLTDAATCLRAVDTEGPNKTAQAVSLHRFREETLRHWLQSVPSKENLA